MGIEDLIFMFDDSMERRVKAEIRVEFLSKDVLDLRESVQSHRNDIMSGKAKIKALDEQGSAKITKKIEELEKQYQTHKAQRAEIEERLKQNYRTGKKAASILTNEELFSIKEVLVNKYAEIKIAKYESKNVIMLLEETKADLANLQRQKADLDNALEERKHQLEIALKDLEGI